MRLVDTYVLAAARTDHAPPAHHAAAHVISLMIRPPFRLPTATDRRLYRFPLRLADVPRHAGKPHLHDVRRVAGHARVQLSQKRR
jgi:hypothetical protein